MTTKLDNQIKNKTKMQLFTKPQTTPINCFICNNNMGEYTSHNNPQAHEGLQIHICLNCKLDGAEVKIFVRNKYNKKMEIT